MDKITIAIADDQEITVEMLSNIVASQDDFVLAGTAGNGEEALDLVRRCKPQILLLDMIMPLVDGKEVMRQLQSDETNITRHQSDRRYRGRQAGISRRNVCAGGSLLYYQAF